MPDDILKEGKEAFELCAEVEADNRKYADDSIRFARLEEQWPDAIRKRRELDGRPWLTFNKLNTPRQIVVNDGRQNRPQINVHPADSQADPAVAQVYEGLIRNIEYCSDADTAYDTAFEAAIDGGVGYFEINTRFASDDTFDLDLCIDAVTNPFSVFGDPYSTHHDSSDWNTAFRVDTLKTADFKRLYPGAQTANWQTSSYGELTAPWLDGEEVMLAKYWKRSEVMRTIVALSTGEIVGEDEYLNNMDLFESQGVEIAGERKVPSFKVSVYLMSGAEVLSERDWLGKYIPIVPVYGNVIHHDGKRHLRSFVHSAIDSQRKFNFDRTMSTELTSLAPRAPFIGPKGAFKTDSDKWETINVENHAFVEYDGATPPQRQPWQGPAAASIQEAELAEGDMKDILGLQDANLGVQDPKEASGRAILARMRQGNIATFHLTDNRNRAIRHAGRVLIDLIPKVYTGQRMVRVLDASGVPSIVGINQPTDVPHGPSGQPLIAQPMLGLQPGQITTLQKVLDLSAGKYDVAVEAGPSYTTQREETAGQMIDVLQAFPEAAPIIAPQLAKSLDWPGADGMAEAFQHLQQQKGQEAAPDGAAAAAKAEAEGQAKAAQIAQEGQLRQQEMERDHQLALVQQQQQAELDRQKQEGQLALQREAQQANLELKREEAEAEFALATWTAQQSMRLKEQEAARHADQTVEAPAIHIGGGIG